MYVPIIFGIENFSFARIFTELKNKFNFLEINFQWNFIFFNKIPFKLGKSQKSSEFLLHNIHYSV